MLILLYAHIFNNLKVEKDFYLCFTVKSYMVSAFVPGLLQPPSPMSPASTPGRELAPKEKPLLPLRDRGRGFLLAASPFLL